MINDKKFGPYFLHGGVSGSSPPLVICALKRVTIPPSPQLKSLDYGKANHHLPPTPPRPGGMAGLMVCLFAKFQEWKDKRKAQFELVGVHSSLDRAWALAGGGGEGRAWARG